MHQRVLVVSGGEVGAVVCPHLASLVTQYGSLAPKWGHELPDMRELGRWSGMLDTLDPLEIHCSTHWQQQQQR